MPYFAELNPQTNEVIRVIVCKTKQWCENELGGKWVNIDKKKGGIGYTYHPDKEKFSSPQPYPSWTLDDQCIWQPPVPKPDDEGSYTWNEETQTWDTVEVPVEDTIEQSS
ncbi:MAG: hypothetical protein CMP56_03980 [Flavobacteriales bacterium]|nr:hypothetical protein [Flavobacteriales bacterium]|tara:strand:- start:994 stop:1323 length:330 start_codon:yes stop_codon:yes gene_type:complete